MLNIERMQNQLNNITSFLIVTVSILSHIFTFIQFSSLRSDSIIIPIIFYSVFSFFALSGFSLYFDLDIILIQKIRLIYFLVLYFFIDLVFFEVFLSVFILAITFYLNVKPLHVVNKKNIIFSNILNIIIIFLMWNYFSKNIILFLLCAVLNILHLYIPILCKGKLLSINNRSLPRNLKEYYIMEFSKQIIPFTSWLEPFLILFLLFNYTYYSLIIFIISSFFCIICDLYGIYMSFSKDSMVTILLHIIVKLSLIIGLYSIYLIGGNTMNYNAIMIPVIAAVFIFNFTAINSLIQDFYKKYNSILLLKEILNLYILSITIIIPAVFVVIFIFSNDNSHLIFISVLSIIYCIGSSVWLIFRIKYLQNQNRIIIKLLAEISKDEIHVYKHNEIWDTENRIDILLKIITSFIRCNDFNSAEDIFNILFHWVNNNLSLITSDSSNYWSIKSNRFNRFFNCITDEVCKSSNTIIQDTYITSIYEQIIINSDFNHIVRYEYIFSSLSKFIENGLLHEEMISKNLLKKALKILLDKIPTYLYEMKPSEEYDLKDKLLYLLHKSEDFNQLKNTLYDKIDFIISLAAEKNNIEFLKSINLFSICFRKPKKEYNGAIESRKTYPAFVEIKIPWNVNYYQVLNLITESYSSIFYKQKENTFNVKLWRSIINDYRAFMYHFKELDITDKTQKAIYNSFYSSYRNCLYEPIKNGVVLNNFDFFEFFCYSNYYCSKEQEDDFIKLFIKSTQDYFKYFFQQQQNDINEIYKTWSRVIQFQKNHSDRESSTELNKYITSLQKKNYEILQDFPQWEKDQTTYFKNLKKQLEEF